VWSVANVAGYHDQRGKSVIDRVISSYTPTIKALAYARFRTHTFEDSADLKALLIGMPKTPGLPSGDLPFVETDYNLFENSFKSYQISKRQL